MKKYKVIFQPEGKKVSALPGVTIAALAAQHGVRLEVPCGAVGKCGKCRIEVSKGAGVAAPDSEEKALLSKKELARGIRLACRAKVSGDAVISIPRSSRLQTQKILDVGIQTEVKLAPAVKKIYFKTSPEVENLPFKFSGTVEDLKKSTAVYLSEEKQLLTVETGDTTGVLYGMAFDVGTTTVVGSLVELTTGIVKATAADMNPQIVYGDDVISRLNFCMENKHGLSELNKKIIGVINKLIKEVCEEADLKPESVYDVVLCGNTTMEHFLLKADPKPLAVYPFVSALAQSMNKKKAVDFGINVNTKASVAVFPVIGGWVGGDTLGVILATNLYKTSHIKLAIDIGTNGEVVLGNKDRLVSASCAAGPAFEGAHIRSGMRASKGAIEKIDLVDGKIVCQTIENAAPVGFCGSGLIDAMAFLVEQGIVEDTGRIKDKNELPGELPAELKENLIEHENGNEFIFAGSASVNISLNQKDVREIQLAKGAMLAGIEILMRELGIKAGEISEVLLAGAFGNYIRAEKALAIGLIPQVELKKIIFCGNAAEEGARKALLSVDLRKEVEEIAKFTKYVDLSASPLFQDIFAESMMFHKKRIEKQ